MALHAVSEVNPYLLPAVMLACGFWGIDTKANPHKCLFPADVNMYDRASEPSETSKSNRRCCQFSETAACHVMIQKAVCKFDTGFPWFTMKKRFSFL
jgi:glutamine synthetase